MVDAEGYFQPVVLPLLASGPAGMLAFGLRGDVLARVSIGTLLCLAPLGLVY